MLLTATILFILLSPGLLLTLPPVGGKVWMSGKMSLISVFVHAVVFFVLLAYRRSIPLLNRVEGFQTAAPFRCGACPKGQTLINVGLSPGGKQRLQCGVQCSGTTFGLCSGTQTAEQTCVSAGSGTYKCTPNCNDANPTGYCPAGSCQAGKTYTGRKIYTCLWEKPPINV